MKLATVRKAGAFYEARTPEDAALLISYGGTRRETLNGRLHSGFPYHELGRVAAKLEEAGYGLEISNRIENGRILR